MELEPSGERMILEAYQSSPEDHLIYLMHLATYRFALPYTAGKRVLDYGCGSGYGSSMIAESAASVVGVDVAEDAVAYANGHFANDKLGFQRVSPDATLPFDDGAFDTVLSFQVFEHVEHERHYLSEIARVLAPNGTLVLATPDRSTRLLPLQQPWNRWHLREYSEASLRRRLELHFRSVEVMGMGGERAVLDIELKRCARLKWMALPMTLPIYPRALRVGLLNLVHRLRGRPPSTSGPTDFEFDESAIRIGHGIAPSVNLIAVARV